MRLSSKKALEQLYNERKNSYKSRYSASKSLSLSTSAYLVINKNHFEKRDSPSSTNIESQQSNKKDQVQTIIINGDDDNERNIHHLNQTSSFIEITSSNKISNNSESNYDNIKNIGTDTFSFKNNEFNWNNTNTNYEESEDRYSKMNYLSLDNNLNMSNLSNSNSKSFFSTNSSLQISNNNNSNLLFEDIKDKKEIKRNDKRYLSLELFSNTSEENIKNSENNIFDLKQHSELESKNTINLKKIIPIYSKKLNLKKFQEYIASNNPVIFDKCTDNNIIYGFSAFTFKNNSNNSRTKISININYSNEHGNFNFFSLYNHRITNKVLDLKYNELSMNKIFINKTFLQDIYGDIILLNSHNSTFSIYNNSKQNLNKCFSYKAILSINNSNTIQQFNCAQKFRIQNNFDFIILLNKGIFNHLSNKEICIIIYKTMKNCIINRNNFSFFLNQSIKNIFENVIRKNGQKDMACIFICFKNLYTLFEKKDLNKIDETLIIIENTIYNYDNEYDEENKKENDDSYQDSIYFNGIIKNNPNISLSFNAKNMSLNDEDLDKKKSNHQKIKKRNFLNCCGFFG